MSSTLSVLSGVGAIKVNRNYWHPVIGNVSNWQSRTRSRRSPFLVDLDLEFVLKDLTDLTTSMRVGTDRIQAIVASLRTFSRLDEFGLKIVDIHAGIDSTLMLLNNRLTTSQQPITVFKEYGQLPLVECDASAINQVWLNLLFKRDRRARSQ